MKRENSSVGFGISYTNMISQYILGLLLAGWAQAGVLIPTNQGPAYSSSVFSQSFTRQDEPLLVAQYTAPLTQLTPVATGLQQSAQYVVPDARQLAPVSVAEYVSSYGPVQPVTYLSQENEKKSTPTYQYAYLVVDPSTGDRKRQKEWRQGGAVRGEYALVQPDGALRKVAYTADDKTGFNAVIRYAPVAVTYDPCIPQFSGQTRETTTEAPATKLPKECDPTLQANYIVNNKGNAENLGTGYAGSVTVDAQKGRQADVKSGDLVEAITEPAIKQNDNNYGTYTPTAYSYTAIENVASTEPKPNDKRSRDLILSYDDIIRCAQEVARIKASQAIRVKAEKESKQQAVVEPELSVLPAARPAIAYVATPFIFPTNV